MVTGWDTTRLPLRYPSVSAPAGEMELPSCVQLFPLPSFPSLGQAPQAGREQERAGKLQPPGSSHGLRSAETSQRVRRDLDVLFAAGSAFRLDAGGAQEPIGTGQSMPNPWGFRLPAGCQRNAGLLGHRGRERC